MRESEPLRLTAKERVDGAAPVKRVVDGAGEERSSTMREGAIDRGEREREEEGGRPASLLKSASVTRGGDGVEEDWRGHRSKERRLSAAQQQRWSNAAAMACEIEPNLAEWKEEKEESRSLNYDTTTTTAKRGLERRDDAWSKSFAVTAAEDDAVQAARGDGKHDAYSSTAATPGGRSRTSGSGVGGQIGESSW
ncbi:hypothetical protein Scep_014973 [Stephania cephalantha]|uniref:Uncharacterized protein n=1 Tax=Stephania cephalantha TaxID=152367 RepID=A0AAP0NZX7_9MAGN